MRRRIFRGNKYSTILVAARLKKSQLNSDAFNFNIARFFNKTLILLSLHDLRIFNFIIFRSQVFISLLVSQRFDRETTLWHAVSLSVAGRLWQTNFLPRLIAQILRRSGLLTTAEVESQMHRQPSGIFLRQLQKRSNFW